VSLPLCHTCLRGNGPSVHQHRAALQRHRAVACSDATTPCRCTASESSESRNNPHFCIPTGMPRHPKTALRALTARHYVRCALPEA
jgi:hypothetical protein